MRNALLFIIIFFSISCNTNNSNADKYLDIDFLRSENKIEIKNIDIDTILTNFSFTYSGDMFWKLRDDSLYLFDRTMGTVDIYNKQGIFSRRALGIGRGPGEVLEEIRTICSFNSGWLLFDNYFVYYFSRDFKNKKLNNALQNITQEKYNRLLENPDPTKDIELYVPTDFDPPQGSFLKDNSVLLKVCCSNPHSWDKRYYHESAIMAEYDFMKGTITKLMGAYPPVYKSDDFTISFPESYYTEYKNKEYLMTFAIDTLIYICDEKFNPQKSFGIEGKMVNKDYKLTNSEKNDDVSWGEIMKEKNCKAYYRTIYYCKDKDITLRTYKTGTVNENVTIESINPSRMQIYKGIDLVGDVPVPDNFEIIAYEAPYFYADGYFEAGEERDKVGIYKFKLDIK